MNNQISLQDIFVTTGQPTYTYVYRQNSSYENTLKEALVPGGRICLVTGPSKTGKTTLYKKVLDDLCRVVVKVQCNIDTTPEDFWKQALEQLNFERIETIIHKKSSSISADGSVQGTFGWVWLAKIIGSVKLGISRGASEEEAYKRILAQPCPNHIIPALKELPTTLVVEDFHFLKKRCQKTISQQWKEFIDSNISVIIVGTTHRAVELVEQNRDLLGRICQIDIQRWSIDDLRQIVTKGFRHLRIKLNNRVEKIIAEESAGLPIITQDACLYLFLNKGYRSINQNEDISFSPDDAYKSLHNVAKTNYKQLETIYNRLTNPEINPSYYEHYALILSCFTQDPLTFALTRKELDGRLNNIISNVKIDLKKPPTTNSITKFLDGLSNQQKSSGIDLLDWSPKDQTLYIIEPSFLFYLRHRELKHAPPSLADRLREIFANRKVTDIVNL